MTIEGLIFLGFMGFVGAGLVTFFGYIARASRDVSIKILFVFLIIVTLSLELLPFIQYTLAERSLENIPETIENLSSFLIASIGGLIFSSLFGPRERARIIMAKQAEPDISPVEFSKISKI
jgi:hypothetical protein